MHVKGKKKKVEFLHSSQGYVQSYKREGNFCDLGGGISSEERNTVIGGDQVEKEKG